MSTTITIGQRVTDAYQDGGHESMDIRPGERYGTVTGGQGGLLAVQWDYDGGWTMHQPDRLLVVDAEA